MTHVLHEWFSWPNGSVLTNLVASMIGFVVGVTVPLARLFRKVNAMHDHVADLHAQTHEHLVAVREHLVAIRERQDSP